MQDEVVVQAGTRHVAIGVVTRTAISFHTMDVKEPYFSATAYPNLETRPRTMSNQGDVVYPEELLLRRSVSMHAPPITKRRGSIEPYLERQPYLQKTRRKSGVTDDYVLLELYLASHEDAIVSDDELEDYEVHQLHNARLVKPPHKPDRRVTDCFDEATDPDVRVDLRMRLAPTSTRHHSLDIDFESEVDRIARLDLPYVVTQDRQRRASETSRAVEVPKRFTEVDDRFEVPKRKGISDNYEAPTATLEFP